MFLAIIISWKQCIWFLLYSENCVPDCYYALGCVFERLESPESNSLSGLILYLHDFEGFLHLADDAFGKEFCIMLGDASGTVTQHFRYHFKTNSPV